MNIWIIHQHAIPPTEPGSTRHYSIARHLKKRGHDVSIVCSAISHQTRTNMLAKRGGSRLLSEHDGVRFLRLRSPRYAAQHFRRAWNFLSFSARVLRPSALAGLPKPDVVIGSSPQPLSALSALVVARRMHVPYVLEVRDLWPQTLCDLGGYTHRNPAIAILRQIERLLYSKSEAIITLLPNSLDYMCLRGATRDKITYIPNGIDLELAPFSLPQSNREECVVMYAGAHGLANGLEKVIEAAARLQQMRPTKKVVFRFIGSGPRKAALQGLARSLELSNLIFENSVPKELIFATLAQADVFILNVRDSPLYRYGMSLNKIFDYLAMARPTVCAASASNNIVADAGAGVSVGADDVEEMAKAVLMLSEMPHRERVEMGLRGRKYAEEHHDFKELSRSVEAVLLKSIARFRGLGGFELSPG